MKKSNGLNEKQFCLLFDSVALRTL